MLNTTQSIPMELITLFASSFFSGALKVWSNSRHMEREERLAQYNLLRLQQAGVQQARHIPEGSSIQWTRRVITLLCVFFIIIFPKLLVLFDPNIPISWGYSEAQSSFWIFGNTIQHLKWITLKGIVITPLDTHTLSAILGLYYGNSIASTR